MASKTIALDGETYELLRRHKRSGETFSDVVRRQLRPPTKITDLAGSLSDVSPRVWKEVAATNRAARRRDRIRQERSERSGTRS
ncbi:MAG TPA: antitoxin VapB family protein [Thermoplasmata archaeon]|nr:antitoxin VapB family protein [Thermoplasmata archaeon]